MGGPAGESSSPMVTTASHAAARAARRTARAVIARWTRLYFHGVDVGAYNALNATLPTVDRWLSMETRSTGWRSSASFAAGAVPDHVEARGVHHAHANPSFSFSTSASEGRSRRYLLPVFPPLTERAFRLLKAVPVPGAILEFGVYQGGGLITMAQKAQEHLGAVPPLYGFDTFAGIPPSDTPLEGHAETWKPGNFADTDVESVQASLRAAGVDATLVPGRFADLQPLSDYGVDRVRLVHIDADIYEGYRDALNLLTPHLQVGSVVLFDESVPATDWSMQSIREHGQRAVREWEEKSGLNLHLIRFEWTVALCVIVDNDYLREHWRVIDDLRKDTVVESVKNVAKKLLGRPREARVAQ